MSFSDSPLLRLEPLDEKLMTSAESLLAAASNEIRVLVESYAKRLTMVRPRRVGNFFMGVSLTFASSAAVSRIVIASLREISAIDRRCFIEVPFPRR